MLMSYMHIYTQIYIIYITYTYTKLNPHEFYLAVLLLCMR